MIAHSRARTARPARSDHLPAADALNGDTPRRGAPVSETPEPDSEAALGGQYSIELRVQG